MAEIYLRDDIERWLGARDPLPTLAALDGQVYRQVADRRTLRVLLGGRHYFLKHHRGVGWPEIFKNLLTLRWPVLGARNEFELCRWLHWHQVRAPVVAAFGERYLNPARRQSLVLTDEITGHTSLEDLFARRQPSASQRRALVHAVADFTRRFHGLGCIHRDYYICHLWLRDGTLATEPELMVIDLHRGRRFASVPRRWLIRDLAALLYSVLDESVGPRDWLRFVRRYRGLPLPEVFEREGALWRAVYRRALRLYAKGAARGMVRGRFRAPW